MNGLLPGDWFAIGGMIISPFCFDNPTSDDPAAKKFGTSVGIQALGVIDVASQYSFTLEPIPKVPGHFTAAEVLGILNRVFEKHRVPRRGVVISKSVWMSSNELLLDDDTQERSQALRKLGVEIPPMPVAEKEAIREALQKLGLRVEFNEEMIYQDQRN